MKCIICNKTMETKVVEGVEIDYCTQCGGVWLDKGEMKALSGLDPRKGRVLACTACKGHMETHVINEVEIDSCPKCETVWLDKGELEKLSGIDPATGRVNILYQFIQTQYLAKGKK